MPRFIPSLLDLKLGARMLLKYPGLTIVGGLGMAVAIAIVAGFSSLLYQFVNPTLPIDEGDRLVGLENWDTVANNEERRSIHDFEAWRAEMRTVVDISAFRNVALNLDIPGGSTEPIVAAEITADGLRTARVAPLLGRTLAEADEAAGAPNVLVLGYDAWQVRFAGDPSVVQAYQPGFRKGFYLPGDVSVIATPAALEQLGTWLAPFGVDLTAIGALLPPSPPDIGRIDLAEGHLVPVGDKHRIVAEAAFAARRPHEASVDLSAKSRDLALRPGQRQHRHEMGAFVPAAKFAPHALHRDPEILVRPGPARRVDAGSAVERRHDQPGIVRQGNETARPGGGACPSRRRGARIHGRRSHREMAGQDGVGRDAAPRR